jgi:hypothetical protein
MKVTEETAKLVWNLVCVSNMTVRQAAKRVGMSEVTAAKIVRGEWTPRGKRKRKEEFEFDTDAEPVYCKMCRAWVYPPCHACAIRGWMRRKNHELVR